MDASSTEPIRKAVEDGGRAAGRIARDAERLAAELEGRAARTDHELALARVSRLNDLSREIAARGRRIDSAEVTLIEAMAMAAARLAAIAREADFDPPPWPAGLAGTIEIRLSETREVTFRIAAGEGRYRR